ncbi:hypothetical protein JZ751_008870 [Albula glossodonta]|uniref:Uncharacterized protein n=1 Tax=Albula glossodonta TaxID=121402 RepID=A0A8T2P1W1_9TELE|nr:hypothetical protein JZ751_008870 [Albula glossodonta]
MAPPPHSPPATAGPAHTALCVSSSSGISSLARLSTGTIQLSLNSMFGAAFFSCISGCTSITSNEGGMGAKFPCRPPPDAAETGPEKSHCIQNLL